MASRHEVMVALDAHAAKVCARLATNAVAELVEATPVDTGWARANWIPSLGRPVVQVVGTPDAPSTAAQAAGLAEVFTFTLDHMAIFVSNHVPYIARLDAGHSQQAPAGFVRLALARAVLASGNGQLTP